MPTDMNIAHGVREFARCTPTAVAVIDGERRLTFGELDERSSRLATALLSAGLAPGDPIAVLSGNRSEYVEVAAGLAKAGFPMVPLNPRSVGREHAFVLNHSRARALIVEHALLDSVADVTDGLGLLLVIGGEGHGLPYEGFLAGGQPRDPHASPSEREPFAIQYTSGTTGNPKGVLLSHRSRVLTMFLGGLDWGIGPGRRTAAIAPMALGAGFCFGYMGPFLGGTTVMLRRWDPEEFLRLVERHRLQSVFLVPTHAHAIQAFCEDPTARFELASLQTLYFNAAALPVPLKQWIIAAFPHVGVHEIYGSTEASVVTALRPDRGLERAGSVGHAWFSTEVKLLDEAGLAVPAGEPGELFSRSPLVMNGYLDDPEATAASLTDDGWVTAGDVARADEAGFITIIDRKKDMIVSGGQNIYPREIENVLVHADAIAEVAVVGVPDERWGERVAAFVVLSGSARPDAEGLEKLARSQLAAFKIPREWRFVDSLPRNANGKVLKHALRRELGGLPGTARDSG